jgi:hypothetical protein
MKIYVLVGVVYEYYEIENIVDVSTCFDELLNTCPNDKPFFTDAQREIDNGMTDHYRIREFEDELNGMKR